jgi:sigma-E factor negative regulatory protein RseC
MNTNEPQSMSYERARVVARDNVEGPATDAIWVETLQGSTCGQCSAQNTCGQGVLNRWFNRRSRHMKVLCDPLQASQCAIGQWVEVAVPAQLVVQASMLAYILPLLAMCILALLFEQLFGSELAAVTGALAGISLGFYAARHLGRRLVSDPEKQPRLSRVL